MAAVYQEAALLPTDPGKHSFSTCAYAVLCSLWWHVLRLVGGECESVTYLVLSKLLCNR